MPTPEDLHALLARPPEWTPPPAEAAAWRALAAAPGAPTALAQEVRWWDALAAGRLGEWDEVSRLAEAGLAEPFTVRESSRLAFLHCLSGSVEEAEHVIAQAVQLHGDEGLPGRMAAWCERQGLVEAARRLR